MADHLFIVARQQPGLFAYLAREFSAEPEVTVIVDRRQEQRRNGVERRAVQRGDRRQSERRTRTDVPRNLNSLGYAFVKLP